MTTPSPDQGFSAWLLIPRDAGISVSYPAQNIAPANRSEQAAIGTAGSGIVSARLSNGEVPGTGAQGGLLLADPLDTPFPARRRPITGPGAVVVAAAGLLVAGLVVSAAGPGGQSGIAAGSTRGPAAAGSSGAATAASAGTPGVGRPAIVAGPASTPGLGPGPLALLAAQVSGGPVAAGLPAAATPGGGSAGRAVSPASVVVPAAIPGAAPAIGHPAPGRPAAPAAPRPTHGTSPGRVAQPAPVVPVAHPVPARHPVPPPAAPRPVVVVPAPHHPAPKPKPAPGRVKHGNPTPARRAVENPKGHGSGNSEHGEHGDHGEHGGGRGHGGD